MAIPGQSFRVIIRNALGNACLADVILKFPKNLDYYTIHDVIIDVDTARDLSDQPPVNWKEDFWNCAHNMGWHSEYHSWRFTLPGDSMLIAQDALVNDHLINSDEMIELHLQATRVKTIFDIKAQQFFEAQTVKFLTTKFRYGPDSLRSGCPEHYCNDCGLVEQTFWMHPTPNKHFRDFSYQQSVKLDQPPLMCSDCAVKWFDNYTD